MEGSKITITIFGNANTPVPSFSCSCGCGCSHDDDECTLPRTVEEETKEIGMNLKQLFGDEVEVQFVDVLSDQMEDYPEIYSILHKVKLPLTAINGEPRFHGGVSETAILQAIAEIRHHQGPETIESIFS